MTHVPHLKLTYILNTAMKEFEKYDGKRRQADEVNLRRELERRAHGKALSRKKARRMIRKQERAVRRELRRLRNLENPRVNGRRGRIPFEWRDRPPVQRRINVKRKR